MTAAKDDSRDILCSKVISGEFRAFSGCLLAQLVKRLVTSGYPDGSRSGGPGFKSG